jgi:hypothetical protein
VQVLNSDELFDDPRSTIERTLAFLGLDASCLSILPAASNVAPTHPELAEEIKDSLRAFFAPHIEELSFMYGPGG